MSHTAQSTFRYLSAIAVSLLLVAGVVDLRRAHGQAPTAPSAVQPYWNTAYQSILPASYPTTSTPEADAAASWDASAPTAPRVALGGPPSETWIAPPMVSDSSGYVDADVYMTDPTVCDPTMMQSYGPDVWHWQVLPNGLIYRSYWAGVHEPRTSIVFQNVTGRQSFWDATLGGRVGILRLGTSNPFHPQGWEIDFEGAALARLTLDNYRDFQSVDFRAGVPLTYGTGNWQFKFGYYHLSSHLGDEFIIAAGGFGSRINYVRDEMVLGASVYPFPSLRLYTEAGYAFNTDGGAEPWELQFGAEYAQPGPTGAAGTPFLAINGHLREEQDFGGDITAQAGWLWRGCSGQTLRIGAHYFNGHSSQYESFYLTEEQIGLGVWYDF